jgi:hypothetical protein
MTVPSRIHFRGATKNPNKFSGCINIKRVWNNFRDTKTQRKRFLHYYWLSRKSNFHVKHTTIALIPRRMPRVIVDIAYPENQYCRLSEDFTIFPSTISDIFQWAQKVLPSCNEIFFTKSFASQWHFVAFYSLYKKKVFCVFLFVIIHSENDQSLVGAMFSIQKFQIAEYSPGLGFSTTCLNLLFSN